MLLISYGTRPEYIKVKSLIDNLPKIVTLFTGQHTTLIGNHYPDRTLNIDFHTSNRLNDIVCSILSQPKIFNGISSVLVQGDTTSAMAIALAAFHGGIKNIIHLEAGLRTYDNNDPYPEELNRQLISRIANIHLCPTKTNKENLLKEGISEKNIFVTGNTGLDNIDKNGCTYENIILITLHRRDNIPIMEQWFTKLNNIAEKYHDFTFIFPLHPNPDIQKYKYLLKCQNINIIAPVEHDTLINLIKKCKFIISDSGGIQEESSFLNKRVIVCRRTTERPETIGMHSILCTLPSNLEICVHNINNNYLVDYKCPYGNGSAWTYVKEALKMQNII
jgi:UDP-N-acetylglucosamine 2-epimerase (non-hydrolysing)